MNAENDAVQSQLRDTPYNISETVDPLASKKNRLPYKFLSNETYLDQFFHHCLSLTFCRELTLFVVLNRTANMLQRVFEDSLVLTQLKCLGITSVIELMEYGYPSRVPFDELHSMYKPFLPPELMKLDPKIFC